jgi:hypothetical protein
MMLKRDMLKVLANLKEKSFPNQPWPVETLTMLQRKNQPNINLKEVVTKAVSDLNFKLIQ